MRRHNITEVGPGSSCLPTAAAPRACRPAPDDLERRNPAVSSWHPDLRREEVGINRQLGYLPPANLIEKYPSFFWNSLSMYLQEGLKFLDSTTPLPADRQSPQSPPARLMGSQN